MTLAAAGGIEAVLADLPRRQTRRPGLLDQRGGRAGTGGGALEKDDGGVRW